MPSNLFDTDVGYSTVNLTTNDLKKTREFYEELLDLDLDYNLTEAEGPFDFYFGGIHFSFSQVLDQGAQGKTSSFLSFSIHCDELPEAAQYLNEMGAEIIRPIHRYRSQEKIIFVDPNGYTFELYREAF